MFRAMVEAQRQLNLAWLEARSLGARAVELHMEQAIVDTANALDKEFPGVFCDCRSCYAEPLDIEEV